MIFLSDNGCPIYTKAGTNGPLLGSKLTLFEGGVRVPFLMQFPGRIRAGSVYRNPIVSRDLFPTIAALGGAEGPAGVKLDGVDLMPFLSGKQKGVPHDVLFWRNGPNSAMRKGKWKMIVPGQGTLRLYDLSKDLGEQHNLAETFPDVVQGLKAEFAKWESQLMKPRWAPVQTVKLPYGGEEIGWTV